MSGTNLQRTERLDCNRDVGIAKRSYGGLELREEGGQSHDCGGSSMPIEEKESTVFCFSLALA